MKENDSFTDTARKYIGKIVYQGKEIIVYYISSNKQINYVRQIINDIQKMNERKDVVIFMENLKFIKENRKFIFGDISTTIIDPIEQNLRLVRNMENIDFYEIVKQIYFDKDIGLADWEKADYVTEDKTYVIVMPFIDTERLYQLNLSYINNTEPIRKIDIITLKQNTEKIDIILNRKINIVEIDSFLGG